MDISQGVVINSHGKASIWAWTELTQKFVPGLEGHASRADARTSSGSLALPAQLLLQHRIHLRACKNSCVSWLKAIASEGPQDQLAACWDAGCGPKHPKPCPKPMLLVSSRHGHVRHVQLL